MIENPDSHGDVTPIPAVADRGVDRKEGIVGGMARMPILGSEVLVEPVSAHSSEHADPDSPMVIYPQLGNYTPSDGPWSTNYKRPSL